MHMSLLEKRLQILLDQERFAKVEEEAARSGRSVAAVIREAIDLRFAPDASARRSAATSFLALTEAPAGPGEDWAEVKAAMADELAQRVP